MRKIDTLVIHHSAGASGSVDQFRREHMARGWADIGYHAVCGNGRGMGDGWIGHGRADEKQGAAVFGANAGKLHVCLVGNFHKPEPGFTGPPTRAQLDALGGWLLQKSWLYAGRFARPPLEVAGHKEVALPTHPTACPGSEFPIKLVRRWFEKTAVIWKPDAKAAVSLGSFIANGGLWLPENTERVVEHGGRRLRVLRADGEEAEVPMEDCTIHAGQTWVRLRALCGALGCTVSVDDDGIVVKVDGRE
jgi:hypothetical protein